MSNKEQSFLKKAVLLIVSNLTTGVLAFIYSMILSRELGAEGMGLYGLIFPINALLLSVITGGMMIAVSKVVSEYKAKNETYNMRKTINTTLILNLTFSVLLVFITYLFSYQISLKVINDLRALNGLRLVLISVIFMALANTYKGYFFGTMRVTIPAIVDIFEKLIRIILLLIFFKTDKMESLTNLVTISFLIFTIGEFGSLVFFFLYYHFDEKPDFKINRIEPTKKILKKILLISVPLMIAELVSSALSTVSTLIIPRRLMAGGISYVESLELIGKFTSMSMQIVFFPIIIIRSIISLLIPDITESLSKNDMDNVVRRVKNVFNFTVQVSLIVAITCLLFADQLGQIMFKQDDLGPYIRFLAYIVPFFYLSAITRGVMNGLGKQNIVLRNTIILSIMETILLYFLVAIPKINVYGLGITLFIEAFIIIVINIHIIRKTIPIKFIQLPTKEKQLKLNPISK